MTASTTVTTDDEGILVITAGYRLRVGPDGLRARLWDVRGRGHTELMLVPALDRMDGPDETLAVGEPVVDTSGPAPVITVSRRGFRWSRGETRLRCGDAALELSWSVRGTGELDRVHLLAGRLALGGRGGGFHATAHAFRTVFSPAPYDPRRLVGSAAEAVANGVVADGRPGRGRWFFTPGPLCLALNESTVTDPNAEVDTPWWTYALAAPVDRLTFTTMTYQPLDGAFGLVLDYEGHTRVDGEFTTPCLIITPGIRDPYSGLRRHREQLADRRAAGEAAPESADRPDWWSRPMFCGWGAQNHLAKVTGRQPHELSSQQAYDRFLAELAEHGLVPGTVVVDDKWQTSYALATPHQDRWPDMRAWIARRHEQGQRVLLWWRAWAFEGLPAEYCVRTPDGVPVALDPSHPGARAVLRAAITTILSPSGLDADGLKIDITADTPSGSCLTRARQSAGQWGITLLHDLLSTMYSAAKEAKADALVITHTPHPAFTDVTDMVRLNDMLRLDDPVPDTPIVAQMRHRAEIVTASCPEVLIDTDDWCVPNLPEWREYLRVKSSLGVPALYYSTHVDRTGERLSEDDYAVLRQVWEAATVTHARPAEAENAD